MHVKLYIWICEELSRPAELATADDTENLNDNVEEFKQYVQVAGVAAADTLATSKALLDFFESFITCAQADSFESSMDSLSTAEAILAASQAHGDARQVDRLASCRLALYDRFSHSFESVKQDMEADVLVTAVDDVLVTAVDDVLVTAVDDAQVVCDGPASVMSSYATVDAKLDMSKTGADQHHQSQLHQLPHVVDSAAAVEQLELLKPQATNARLDDGGIDQHDALLGQKLFQKQVLKQEVKSPTSSGHQEVLTQEVLTQQVLKQEVMSRPTSSSQMMAYAAEYDDGSINQYDALLGQEVLQQQVIELTGSAVESTISPSQELTYATECDNVSDEVEDDENQFDALLGQKVLQQQVLKQEVMSPTSSGHHEVLKQQVLKQVVRQEGAGGTKRVYATLDDQFVQQDAPFGAQVLQQIEKLAGMSAAMLEQEGAGGTKRVHAALPADSKEGVDLPLCLSLSM